MKALVREAENGSVFVRSLFDEKEYLLYDFGLVEGDSFKLYNDMGGYFYIDSIRTKPFGIYGEARRHFYISNNGTYNIDKWIEGIGNLRGVLTFTGEYILCGYEDLFCFHENDSLKYMSPYETCFLTGTYVSTEKYEQSPQPVVHISEGRMMITLNQTGYSSTLLRLVDMNGRIVFSREFVLSDGLEISTSGYLPGIYIYQIISPDTYYSGKIFIAQ